MPDGNSWIGTIDDLRLQTNAQLGDPAKVRLAPAFEADHEIPAFSSIADEDAAETYRSYRPLAVFPWLLKISKYSQEWMVAAYVSRTSIIEVVLTFQ